MPFNMHCFENRRLVNEDRITSGEMGEAVTSVQIECNCLIVLEGEMRVVES